jgi:chemotaxis protein histidine kinase CheA
MNKTLLLVICDFLLLNILALTRWENAEPVRPQQTPAASSGADPATKDQDIVDVMKMSLEDERAQREQLAQQLQSTAESLQSREQALAQLQTERSQLSNSLTETQRNAQALAQKVESASRDAAISQEKLAQMQRELEQRQADAERQKQQLAQLEAQQAEARQRIESLNVAVKVAEQEKVLLRETADTLKTQVEQERQERIKVQETTTQLAQGVGTLAEKSTELTREIRDNRPINANTLFNEFLANRVQTNFTVSRPALFGEAKRQKDARTIFVSDGKQTYALLHIDDTPFNFRDPGADWENISITFAKGGNRGTVPAMSFLSVDPRIIALPVDEAQAAAVGAKVYQTSLDPVKFPEALLISNGGAGYGEVAFKLDASLPGFVRMDNRLMKRMFGDFAPSRGDLVLSKTGELLGIMVNSDYCAVINNFLPARTIRTGNNISQKTGAILDEMAMRVRALPFRMQ